MTTDASAVIHQAVDQLQDVTSIRWPVAELVRWLNAGQREIIIHRPDARNVSGTVACVAGTKQALPAGAQSLIDVPRNNSAGSKRSITMVDRSILDAQIPDWHSLAQKAEILHVMYDPKDPLVFWTYPPASTSAALDVNYAALATDIAQPAAGSIWSDVLGTIGVADKFSNALVDYILYRAFMKPGDNYNPQRAGMAAQTFAGALGIDVKSVVSVAPQVPPAAGRSGGA